MFRKFLDTLAVAAVLSAVIHATPLSALNNTQNTAANKAIIVAAAERHGIKAKAFLRVAQIESGWNSSAFHPVSRAAGLFQFIPQTARAYGLVDPFNAQANAEAAAKLWKDNEARLSKALGRKPSAGELYLAHQQGVGGAIRLLSRPNSLAVSIVGQKALLLNGGRLDMTASTFANLWIIKFQGFE